MKTNTSEGLLEIAELRLSKLDELVKNIKRQTYTEDSSKAIDLINSGKWCIHKSGQRWREEDDVIYLTLPPTECITGLGWEQWYKDNGYFLSDEARFLLNSPNFKLVNSVTTEVVILLGSQLFRDTDRSVRNIRDAGHAGKFTQGQKLFDPNTEIGCLIRKNLSNDDIERMGVWGIVTMHEPIKNSEGFLAMLSAQKSGSDKWLSTECGRPDYKFMDGLGFAFIM